MAPSSSTRPTVSYVDLLATSSCELQLFIIAYSNATITGVKGGIVGTDNPFFQTDFTAKFLFFVGTVAL
jgi:hypothetical protein